MFNRHNKILSTIFTATLLTLLCSSIAVAAEQDTNDSGQVPAYNYDEDTICNEPNK